MQSRASERASEMRCGAVRGERERQAVFFLSLGAHARIENQAKPSLGLGGIFTKTAFMAFFHGHWARILGMGLGIWEGFIWGLESMLEGWNLVVLLLVPRTIHEGVVHVTPICGEPMTRSSTICLARECIKDSTTFIVAIFFLSFLLTFINFHPPL